MGSTTQAQFDSLLHDGLARTYLVHTPIGYTGTTPLPLIIAMHGGFGSATNLQDQSQLSVKADAEHFIVVYPEGVSNILNIRTWNAGWCCGYASNNNIDDVGFISTLLDTMFSQYNIDTNRVYATGMSNGGFMSFRLACELSDRIAAIAPVAASLSVPTCNPTRPIPIVQFHSYLDASVPYQGGIGSGVSNHYNPPHDSVLNGWSLKNNCTITNDTVVNNSQYTFVKWSDCDCNTEIHYYISTDGGHSWPGGNQTVIGDPPSNFINANDLMWDFFELHSMNCDTTTSQHIPSIYRNILPLFPNPTGSKCSIEVEGMKKVKIVDETGKKVNIKINYDGKKIQLDLSGKPPGVYRATIILNNGTTQSVAIVKY